MDDKTLAFWQEVARQVDKELLRDPLYSNDFYVTRVELYGWDYIKRQAAARRFEDDHDVW